MVRVTMSAVACALAAGVAAQNAEQQADLVREMFTHQVAVTSVGVERCGIRHPNDKDRIEAAYGAVRDRHLNFFLMLELSKQYKDVVALETTRLRREKEVDEYCAALPRLIEQLSELAPQVESRLKR